jgi:hypothetical protein
MPRIEFEHVRGAVVAIHQAHLVRDVRIIVPEFDRPDMLLVISAKQHHHRHQKLACKHRQCDCRCQSGLLGFVGTLESAA